ncbi:MAG: heavy metal translocating P-type ATPase [Anaerolineales bacterium]|nr:heavy metal translocating P-type ATPase [Anaerolineales bacterium]
MNDTLAINETTERRFRVTGMDCANCAASIQTGVARLADVDACEINFTSETLRVNGAAPAAAIVARVEELGYGIDEIEPGAQAGQPGRQPPVQHNFLHYMTSRRDTQLALLATLLLLPGLLFDELLPGLGVSSPLINLASVAAMLLAGSSVMRNAWRSLRIARQLNISVLMSIAAIGAVIIGAYTEAAVVMVLFVIGEALEGFTAERARSSIRSLMSLQPAEAICLVPEDGRIIELLVNVSALNVGDRILVKPGERIPMDGRVVSGASAVNQAPITGESRLIDKQAGAEVFASSINGEGALEIEVTHLAEDNTISRMIRMVEEAQEQRAPTQRFIDRFSQYYTPAVIVIAALVALIPTVVYGLPLVDAADPTAGWLYRALTLLVVACPCALVISTPVALVSAISNGARNGVLFKGGVHVENLAKIKAIAFDKTGTLTNGAPSVVAYRSVDCILPDQVACDHCDDLLALASAVERRAEHPLARAVVHEAAVRGVSDLYPAASGVATLTGRGVTGEVSGQRIAIGSHSFFDQSIPHPSEHCDALTAVDAQGYSTMLVSRNDSYQGYIAAADTVRPSSRAALAELKRMGLHHLVMLTGDNAATAQIVADEVGVSETLANCLPEDKVDAVRTLQARYGEIAMVGDGINDAPALAASTVGIAIGNTAQAMETADVTLMRDSLLPLPFAIRLSRAAMRTVKVNVAFSLLVKFVVFVLVLAGTGTMWMAVLADVGMSLLVTLNGMRLLRRPAFPAEPESMHGATT